MGLREIAGRLMSSWPQPAAEKVIEPPAEPGHEEYPSYDQVDISTFSLPPDFVPTKLHTAPARREVRDPNDFRACGLM